MLTGTIVNALAVFVGSLAGVGLSRLVRTRHAASGNLGKRLQETVMHGLALCVVYLGISGSLQGENSLIAILSMALGALVGETLDLDGKMQALGQWVQRKAARFVRTDGGHSIADGFVTASLLYCVGAMAIVGALQDGISGDHSTLFAKSLLDGISSIIFGASLGVGVAFSAVMILLYQGTIALSASFLDPVLRHGSVIAEMNCVGCLLILAIGLNMLGLTKIKVMNLLPAVFFPIVLCRIA